MVYRVYVEKKDGLNIEADSLKKELNEILMIKNVENVRILNRYDTQNISKELFELAVSTVFSEIQLDNVSYSLPQGDFSIFATEYLPGQFDQRANSASECIQIISKGDRPKVKSAKVYIIEGNISDEELKKIKAHVINPVESREASLDKLDTLDETYPIPENVETLDGFIKLDDEGLFEFLNKHGLAMDLDDIRFCRDYFVSEDRDPTITEIKMIDTYWSDHCRHTTFLTTIDSVKFADEEIEEAYQLYINSRKELSRNKPVNLMDIATIGAKLLKKQGKLEKLDESEEINACTVKITINHDGKDENWLLLFKNETHNHPTEIEPFGGAATCIGGAIRDPLSGRAYVYAAMRVTGAGDPLTKVGDTIAGKLPQRKIVTTAANGYSSYGNQIGLATGQVDEIYHPGYVAKRMEIGAVIAAAPQENVKRLTPVDGDIVILLGGRTGRDGCGGATGSSKSHTVQSLQSCGAEIQKGNAPEERKLQRLFRNKEAASLIKRCNDFGAGGVSVAIGELADGLEINLDAVKKKYEGLDGTELAISESQERMAVVVDKNDAEHFMNLAHGENLEASIVAVVKNEKRLKMFWRGQTIVDVSREFLNSNGAQKHIDVEVAKTQNFRKETPESFESGLIALSEDLNTCSKRGLAERFDSTIGSNTVLMPFGGKNQLTPSQSMVHKIATQSGDTDTCSFMAWGYNPFIAEKSPYHAAYLAVVESCAKLIASGSQFKDVYLTFQEYFEKPMKDSRRWGKPLSALLGALKAQLDLQIAAIGGKDSMSGSFENIDVPPTLVSFAVSTGKCQNVVSPEFKKAHHKVVLLEPEYDKNGLPKVESLKKVFAKAFELISSNKAVAAYTPTLGGIAEAVMKMSFGNDIGFEFDDSVSLENIFEYKYGAIMLEVEDNVNEGILLGTTTEKAEIAYKNSSIEIAKLLQNYENKLESIYPCNKANKTTTKINADFKVEKHLTASIKIAKPKVLIPVFPGTNCEYDSAKAVESAGAEADIFVINNLSGTDIAKSIDSFAKKVQSSQIIFIPGGFSGGDEPDGSGKFITAFFRNEEIKAAVHELLQKRDGLMCGICNGFQALIKLGLLPFGQICDPDANSPTLTFNTIGRHQSRIVRTRIASNKSPWLSSANVGDTFLVPISHGEGRFLASDEVLQSLRQNGQIATQYVDFEGNPTDDIRFNPNNSIGAVEGITSPDGRIIGKMGHSERIGKFLYKNVPGEYDIGLFKNAVEYFK